MKSPSEIPRPPIRFPSRQPCLYIASPGWIICSKSTASLIHEKLFKTILSILHKASGVTIDFQNKTATCQLLKVREQIKVTMCHRKSFWKKKQNLPVIAYFFELPPSTFFIFCFLQKPFQFLLLLVSRCYFHMALPEIPYRIIIGWKERAGCHWHLRDQNPLISRLEGNVESFLKSGFIWYAAFMLCYTKTFQGNTCSVDLCQTLRNREEVGEGTGAGEANWSRE